MPPPKPSDPTSRQPDRVTPHVRWLLGVISDLGYDPHALAHDIEPLTGEEYERRYNAPGRCPERSPEDSSRRCELGAGHTGMHLSSGRPTHQWTNATRLTVHQ
jgi:hypothetical protein